MAGTHRWAVVLSIGDELVLGQALDTNSRWLSGQLMDGGVPPLRHVTVADEVGAIVEELRRAAGEAELVIVTGGLGPTLDDLTRESLALAMGDELVEDADALAQVRGWYDARGRVMPAPNRVQALRPSRAAWLENRHGTAPGLRGMVGGADVFCLPGPPREMRPMFERFVEPALRPGRLVRTRVLRSFGLGESRVAELLGDAMSRERNPLVGTTASAGVVAVRLRWEQRGKLGEAPRESLGEVARAALDETERVVRAALGAAVFTPEGGGDVELPDLVLDLLRTRGQRLAIAESCTGGLLGAMVTGVPGSSASFAGGWITYTNAMKAGHLGVPETFFREVQGGAPGAVSGEVAQAMALGALARARFALEAGGEEEGVDHALAVTGIAGPEGGSEAKPVGTVWIGYAGADGAMDTRRFLFAGDREAVRQWAAVSALGLLRLRLVGTDLTLQGEQERWSA